VSKRLIQLVAVLFGVVTITFFFTHAPTLNPSYVWSGPGAPQPTSKQCIDKNDLDKPLFDQYVLYLGKLLSGDWSTSPRGVPVLPTILAAFPETLELVLAALFLMVAVGIPLGVIAANNSGRWSDHLVRTFYLSGWATPTYLGGGVLSIAIGPLVGLPHSGNFGSIPSFPEPFHMSVLDSLANLDFPAAVEPIAHRNL